MLGDPRRREDGARETASRRHGRWLALLLLLISCPGGLYVAGSRSGHGGDGEGDEAARLAAARKKAACAPGLLRCGGACVDPQTSASFCGASADCEGSHAGAACAPGRTCEGGTCAPTCPDTHVVCGGACVDPRTSGTFCGASADCSGHRAGLACGPRQACAGGVCVGNVATLLELRLSAGALRPAFAPGTLEYAVRELPREVSQVQLTPIAAERGALIRVSGERVASGGTSKPQPLLGGLTVIPIDVTAPGGATMSYTVVFEKPLAPAVYSAAASRGALDLFGPGVSQSGDVLAVAAHEEGSPTSGGGAPVDSAVHVFRRSGTSWVQETAIRSPTPAGPFGGSISLSGDVLAVGGRGARGAGGYAPGAQPASGDGGVYVFRRTGGAWVPAASAAAGGVSVGAAGAEGVGGVYVFRRRGTGWVLEAHVRPPRSEAADQFGGYVALSGDTLTVGPPPVAGDATTPRAPVDGGADAYIIP